MIRPTRRLAAWLGLGFPICLALGIADAALWPLGGAYLAAVLAVAGLDALLALRIRDLSVEVVVERVLNIGETVPARIRLASRRALSPIFIEHRVQLGDIVTPGEIGPVFYQPGTEAEFDIPLTPRERGLADLKALWLRWAGPFGLTIRQTTIALDRELRVTPNIRAVRQGAIALSAREAFFGTKSVDQSGDGSEFDALKDYAAGMDRRTIEWKHSARSGKLVCKEFRVERNHQVILAYDTGYLMREPVGGISRLDHTINAGLLLTYTALKSGDRVGMFAFGARPYLFAAPSGTMNAFARMQHLSGELAYLSEESNFTLGLSDLSARLNRRSLIVLMTDFVDTVTAELMVENVARLATRHLILFLTLRDPDLAATTERRIGGLNDMTRAVVAYDIQRDRQVLFERLRRLGVHCLEATHDQVGPDLINRYLRIKRRELI